MEEKQIERMFTYHPPSAAQATKYILIREAAKGLALLINKHCPESREKSLALTGIQLVVMWANASIAINENPEPTST